MPSRIDKSAVLARNLVLGLEQARAAGRTPLILRQLLHETEPAAPHAMLWKALAHRDFATRFVLAKKKCLESPIALAEDIALLAASPQLLGFVLDLACSPKKPACDLGTLARKLSEPLRQHFTQAMESLLRQSSLPESVEILVDGKKTLLHDLRYPIPKRPEAQLAEAMVEALARAKVSGNYPMRLESLLHLCPDHMPATLRKALQEPIAERLAFASKPGPRALVGLHEDLEQMAGSAQVIEEAITLAMTSVNQGTAISDVAKKLARPLQPLFLAAIKRQIEHRRLPAGVGCLWHKKKQLLFLVSEVLGGSQAPPPDLTTAIEVAFAKLESQARLSNYVSLADLRREIQAERQAVDEALRQLRLSGKFSLSAAEGRHGIGAEERAAGIEEGGALLLYLSRKQS